MNEKSVPLNISFSKDISKYLVIGFVIAAVCIIYLLPYLLTFARVGYLRVPPIFETNLYLYLGLSNLRFGGQNLVVNPWYGTLTAWNDILYLRFGLALRVFNVVWNIVGRDWTAAVMVWTVLYIASTALTALWLFETILPKKTTLFLVLGLLVLMCLDLTSYELTFAAWRHLPSLAGFESRFLELPFVRTFYPQPVIPLMLGYVALQIKAVRATDRRLWLGLGVIQFVAFLTFPFAVAVMLCATGGASLYLLVSHSLRKQWRGLGVFAVVTSFADGAYLLATGSAFRGLVNEQGSFLRLDLSLPGTFLDRVMLIGIIALIVGIFLLRNFLSAETRWVICGLGLGNLVLLYSDVVLSPDLQVSSHIGYLIGTTLAILVVVALDVVYAWGTQRFPPSQWLIPAVSVLLVVHGILVARGSALKTVAFHTTLQEQSMLLDAAQTGERDLIIAPVDMAHLPFVDAPAVWIPLVGGRVLFAESPFFALPPDTKLEITSEREAVFLYLNGRTAKEVGELATDPRAVVDSAFLGSKGIYAPNGFASADLQVKAASVQEELVPQLENLERNPDKLPGLLKGYDRILVMDSRATPEFSANRLAVYLNLIDRKEMGDSTLSVYTLREK